MLFTLGLDLGTNSIGWALVRQHDNGVPEALASCGVRIFEEAVAAKTRAPKNQARRAARLARRVVARRSRRRAHLRNQLIEAGLLPPEMANAEAPERILNALGDPYELRTRALDARVEAHQVGRILMHLCARRGFQSNRKTRWGGLVGDPDAADLIKEAEANLQKSSRSGSARAKEEEREQGVVLAEVAELHRKIEASGKRTLGEYLASLPKGERRRARHTDRQMYKDEFDAIWDAQEQHHKKEMNTGLRAAIYKTLFHQRPLKHNPKLVGFCSLEPRSPRAATARLESQRVRLLQDVNNLAVRDPLSLLDEPLTPEQRAKLAAELEKQQSMSWSAARKMLGFKRFERFNLEEGSKEKRGLTGNVTAAKIRSVIGGRWDVYDRDTQAVLVEDLLTIQHKPSLFKRLQKHWEFDRKQSFDLTVVEFEPGYSNHSLKALRKLLPHLEEGMKYSEARQAAGYGYERDDTEARASLGEPPEARNPVVEKALVEVRKVVNAIILEYGKPAAIRVEMARDMKMTQKEKAAFERQQRENERLNAEAKAKLVEIGKAQTSRDDLIKYRLWKESNGLCPYTGKTISLHELFGPDVDVEHIIPYSRCLDDSYMNKTLCMAVENRQVKRKQTPWEAYGNTPRWEEIVQRVKEFPAAKVRRFRLQDVDDLDGFVSRQLNDTRYISRLAKDYVATLGVSVEAPRGGTTAMLRHQWGLNRLLSDSAEKNRADHRHHALDAAVVAVTNRSLYQRLARLAQQAEESGLPARNAPAPDLPWVTFADDLERALGAIAVSHAPLRKLSGAFHEDTAYGLRYVPDAGAERFVYRKALDANFTRAMVEKVVDPVLRKAVMERMDSVSNPKDAFKEPFFHPTNPETNPQRQPVRRVRIQENLSRDRLYAVEKQRNRNGEPFKFHSYGNNHHVEIFRDRSTGQIEARFVTTMEAAKRTRRDKTPIVDRAWDGKDFLMSLAINDMVELDEGGTERLYRVQQLDPANNRLVLRHHLAATLNENAERVIVAIHLLIKKRLARKVSVGPLGGITAAHD